MGGPGVRVGSAGAVLFKVLDPLASIHEMFVHHEDVRRTQTGWEPRELDASTAAAVKRRVAMISRAGMSKSMAAVPAQQTLRTPDGQTVVTVGSGSPVTVTGEPLELLLFAFGRNAVRVDFGGMTMSPRWAAKRGFSVPVGARTTRRDGWADGLYSL